ncbi:MAG: ATP-binding protein, partial [Candidatus Omnitrophota bacterium]
SAALGAQKAILGEVGSGLSVDYRGKKVLSAWRPIRSLGWGLVVKVDENEAFMPIKKLRDLLIFIILVAIFSAIAAAIAIAKSIADPIQKLCKGTEIIGSGNLDYRIGIDANDEIGRLSRSFDMMTANLKKTMTSIDMLNKEMSERKSAEFKREKVMKWQHDVNVLQQSLLTPATLKSKLNSITENVVRIFDADFCRIWLIRPGDRCAKGCIHAEVTSGPHICRYRDRCLHLISSSGRYTHLDGKGHARVPFGAYKIGLIASSEEHKFLTNDVTNDPRVHDHEWARELGLVSFAGYQLRIPGGDRYGVLALFAKHPISPEEDSILDNLSNTVAFVVRQSVVEEDLWMQSEKLGSSLKESFKSREILLSMLEDNSQIRDRLEKSLEKLKAAQMQLVHAEKMEAVGRMASGIAHEVKNPLGIILQGINYFESELAPEEKDNREMLLMMKDGVKRADNIVRALLDFSRVEDLKMKECDINTIIKRSIDLVRHKLSLNNVESVYEMGGDIPKMFFDKEKLEQVFINLFNNAIDAMPQGGKLFVRTYLTELKVPGEKIGHRESDIFKLGEKAIVVEVEDTGMGIDKDVADKVFDPFFTTKNRSEGTGLGLSIAKSIVEMHKGLIHLKSEKGKGTKFTIIFKMPKGEMS